MEGEAKFDVVVGKPEVSLALTMLDRARTEMAVDCDGTRIPLSADADILP